MAKIEKQRDISLNIRNRLCKRKMENHIRRALALEPFSNYKIHLSNRKTLL
jgi:hypothetical protein